MTLPVQFFYLHGFNSGFSLESSLHPLKIKQLEQLAPVVGRTTDYLNYTDVCCFLEDAIRSAVEKFPGETILVGTSLGGYFARYFSKKLGLRSIIINPASEPYHTLFKAVGPQTNYFTGERYEVTENMVRSLNQYQTLDTGNDCLMILAQDDEVLDFKRALYRYGETCQTIILPSGGHRMEDLNKVLDEIRLFINRLPANDNSIP